MDGPEAVRVAAVLRYRPNHGGCMTERRRRPRHYQSQPSRACVLLQFTKWNDRFADTEPFRVDHLVYRPTRIAAEITHWHSQFVVDISDTIEQKIEAIRCYRSQFDDERFAGLEHYVRCGAGVEGGSVGVRYGELFALPRPLGVTDMVSLLGDWQFPPPFKPGPTPTLRAVLEQRWHRRDAQAGGGVMVPVREIGSV